MTRFLFERQQLPDGSMPRNSLTNGKPAPDSLQHPARRVRLPAGHGARRRPDRARRYYEDHIRPAANFVASHGPSFGPERWEEQSGFSPSTIAAEIAGLIAAARIADLNDDARLAPPCGAASPTSSSATSRRWTLTTNGPLSPQPYFIRLSKNGDPNAAIIYNVGNGGPTSTSAA